MVRRLKKNKKLLIIIIPAIILLILTIVIIFMMDKPEPIIETEEIDVEQLRTDFDHIFNNNENEFVVSQIHIEDEKNGIFDMSVNIPRLNIEGETAEKINNEINQIFINKLMKVGNESSIYTILKIDFSTEINDDILSLAIKCVLKEGANPQRTIIKTYNYDLNENKEVEIDDLIKDDKKDEIQKQIEKKIENEIKRENTIVEQGYNVYRRDLESDIYKLENATEFYIGKDNVLYIIYCYGNNSYTSETDLIITKI